MVHPKLNVGEESARDHKGPGSCPITAGLGTRHLPAGLGLGIYKRPFNKQVGSSRLGLKEKKNSHIHLRLHGGNLTSL